MKKLFVLLLSIIVIFTLAACNESSLGPSETVDELEARIEAAFDDTEEPEQEEKPAPAEEEVPAPKEPAELKEAPQEAAAAPSAATKTMAYFMEYASGGDYTMEMKTIYGGMETVSLSVYSGGNVYTESEVDGMKSMSIIKDDAMYVLDPSSKTCIKMSVEMAEMQDIFADESEHYETAVSTGETEVNGENCYYEEFTVEGSSVKYCFSGDDLKYMVTEESGEEFIIEVLRMEKGADSSLFEIPSDYTMIEM